jgi:cytochrome c-type biogenesis protein CcmH/NrfF
MNEKRANEVFGGTFLIGMAILFLINWWWPGILYVIGIAMLVRAIAQGRRWMDERAGLVALAIAVVFTLIDFLRVFSFNWWPVVLILLGVYLLFGNRRLSGHSGSAESDKRKNDDFV